MMPTFKEIAKELAGKVVTASSKKSVTGHIKEAQETNGAVYAALQEINGRLGDFSISGKPLTDEQREEILKLAGEELKLKQPDDFVKMTKAASNTSFLQMVQQISTLVQQVKK
jgi:hypothetical protein